MSASDPYASAWHHSKDPVIAERLERIALAAERIADALDRIDGALAKRERVAARLARTDFED
jgi:hypothetical protein